MAKILEWAMRTTPEAIEQRYGRMRHCLDQAIINQLWRKGDRDPVVILGLLRKCLTPDKSQILRDDTKHGERKAKVRIARMLRNAERSDLDDMNEVLAQGRALQAHAAEHLDVHARAVLKECIRRAVNARGAFAMSTRDAMIAACCTRYQAQRCMHVLARSSYIALEREHVKARQWARRWRLGDVLTVPPATTDTGAESGQSTDTASPYGGRGGCVRKLTTSAISIDPEIASAVYAQIGHAAHDMHAVLCRFEAGATVAAFSRAADVERVTARRWLRRLSEFTLAEKRGRLWLGVQPDLVRWTEIAATVNVAGARDRIRSTVEAERAAFEDVARRMDAAQLADAAIDELMRKGEFRDRRAAYRATRAACLARPQASAHEHHNNASAIVRRAEVTR